MNDLERLARRAASGDVVAARRLLAALEAKRPDETLPVVQDIAHMVVDRVRSSADPEDLEEWIAKAGTQGSRRVTDLIDYAIKATVGIVRGRYERFVAKSILSDDPEGDRLAGDLSPDVWIEFRTDLVDMRVERLVRNALRGTS